MRLGALLLIAFALVPTTAGAANDPCATDGSVPCTTPRPLVSTTVSPASPRPGEPVELAASSSGLGVTFAWDLDGDGSFADATGAKAATVFSKGTHTVRVLATDQFGRTSTEERSIAVDRLEQPPSIELSVATMVQVDRKLGVAVEATDTDGTIVKFELDLDGDGAYEIEGAGGEGYNASTRALFKDTTYHTGGERLIRARVTDDQGLTAEATATVRVLEDVPASVVFLSSEGHWTPTSDAPTTLTGDGMFPGVKYEFDVDGDGTYELDNGANRELPVTYAPGPHTFGVRITDVRGNVTTARTTTMVFSSSQPLIDMFAAAPRTVFGYVGEALDLGVTIVAPARTPSYDVTWDIDGDGDYDDGAGSTPGTSGAGSVVHNMHTFTTPGEHQIRVRVTGAGRPTYDFAWTVTIGASGHTAHTPNVDLMALGATLKGKEREFTVYRDNNTTLAFDLDGDGQFDETPHESEWGHFKWTFQGPTTIAVRATDTASGDTAMRTTQVLTPVGSPGPYAVLSIKPFGPGNWLLATYTAKSNGDAACCTPAWDFDADGDYDDGNESAPLFTPGPGEQTVGLRVTDDDGLSSTVRRTFTVGSAPPVTSWWSDANQLKASVADPDGKPITSLAWDLDGDGQFDDASGSTAPVPATAGRVGLLATDADRDIGVAYASYVPALGLRLRLKVTKVKLATLLSRGLTVKTGCPAGCRATATLTVEKATAKRLKLRSVKLGSAKGGATVKVKLSAKARKALRKVRSLKVKVAITATANGRTASAQQALVFKR